MAKIALLDATLSKNKGSMGRLEGMIKCLNETIPNAEIILMHRCFDPDDSEFRRLAHKYPELIFQEHPWFKEKGSFLTTGIYFLSNSLKFKIRNFMEGDRFREYDAFVDLNFIEPERFTDSFGLIIFMGVLFTLLGLSNILSTKRPVVVSSATIGPYGKFLSILARRYLNKVDLITFRERYSLEYMDQLKVDEPPQILTADLAFLMDPPQDREITDILEQLEIDVDGNYVGITPAAMFESHFSEAEYVKLIADISNFIIAEFNYKIIYLANTFQDEYLLEKISKRVNHPQNIISFPFQFSASHTKGIISLCDLFICSRFHALVASTSLGVPSIGIVSYSYNKFHGILGEMMQQDEYLLDIDKNFQQEPFLRELKVKVKEILNNQEEISEKLKAREKIVREEVLENGRLIQEMILSK